MFYSPPPPPPRSTPVRRRPADGRLTRMDPGPAGLESPSRRSPPPPPAAAAGNLQQSLSVFKSLGAFLGYRLVAFTQAPRPSPRSVLAVRVPALGRDGPRNSRPAPRASVRCASPARLPGRLSAAAPTTIAPSAARRFNADLPILRGLTPPPAAERDFRAAGPGGAAGEGVGGPGLGEPALPRRPHPQLERPAPQHRRHPPRRARRPRQGRDGSVWCVPPAAAPPLRHSLGCGPPAEAAAPGMEAGFLPVQGRAKSFHSPLTLRRIRPPASARGQESSSRKSTSTSCWRGRGRTRAPEDGNAGPQGPWLPCRWHRSPELLLHTKQALNLGQGGP